MDFIEYPPQGKVRLGNISFSERELRDILKAWLAVSFAFAIILSGGFNNQLFTTLVISAFTVGIGFISHEMGHKVLAQKYGAWAEFRSWDQMLILGVLMAVLLRVVFIAPGAVMITGRTIGKSRNGKISAMGPIMNFGIAILFLIIMFIFPTGIMNLTGQYGFTINTWLGLFNLIPFAMFDGKKIWEWNKAVYAILVVTAIALFVLRYLLFGGSTF